jgi:D-alanine-D-alanine ligase
MKIVVLAGGISTERDVSLSSGRLIHQALVQKGHQAILVDSYLGCEEFEEDVFVACKDMVNREVGIEEADPDIQQIKSMRADGGNTFFGPQVLELCEKADLVFIALHGTSGENGKVQGMFDLLGIKYTGTNYASAMLAMDKTIAKEIMNAYQIPTPKGVRLKKGQQDKREISVPCVVKTVCGGSSVGVYIVTKEEDYESAKEKAFLYEDELVIEEYIKGREFSVGVLDGKALPIIEIAPKEGFYDYKNKYQKDSTVETCPANLSKEAENKMKQCAEKVFFALRYETYARMDFLMKEDESIYCLEANTLPGMTPTSLLPQEAAANGMNFEELCETIVELAMKKKAEHL